MEAVKKGSAAIGMRSKTHVVLACLNKASSELSSRQKKIFKVDDHIGVAIAGFPADGLVLSRYIWSECINYSYTYQSRLAVERLVVQLVDKAQLFARSPRMQHVSAWKDKDFVSLNFLHSKGNKKENTLQINEGGPLKS